MEGTLNSFDELEESVEENEIKSKLTTMSFEDLQKLKAELGTKLYKEACTGSKKVTPVDFKRLNKNRPREASSKVKPKQEIRRPNSKLIKDPRFDPLMGTFDKSVFEKNYSFISDIRKKEREKLKKLLKNEENEVEANKIKYLIKRMDNQDREKKRRQKEEAKKVEERKEYIKAYQSGIKPHFKSKFEKKVGNIVDKYAELKNKGKLVKYMEKKEKKRNLKFKKKQYLEQNMVES